MIHFPEAVRIFFHGARGRLEPEETGELSELTEAFRFLRSHGWFSTIDPRLQDALQAEARIVRAKRGDQVFHFGAPGGGLFGVITGAFLISFPREDGVLQPLVPFGPGFWIGDLAALSGKSGIVGLEIQRDVETVNVPAQRVRALVRETPEFWADFYQLNRINVGLALRLLAAMTVETVDEKVALRLNILSD